MNTRALDKAHEMMIEHVGFDAYVEHKLYLIDTSTEAGYLQYIEVLKLIDEDRKKERVLQ